VFDKKETAKGGSGRMRQSASCPLIPAVHTAESASCPLIPAVYTAEAQQGFSITIENNSRTILRTEINHAQTAVAKHHYALRAFE